MSIIGNKLAGLALHLNDQELVILRKCSILARYVDEADETRFEPKWYTGANRPDHAPHMRHSQFIITAEGAMDPVHANKSLTIQGRVLGFVPLRNRRMEMVTYLGEGYTEYLVQKATGMDGFLNEGDIGYGMSEFLDQIETESNASKM